MNVDYTLIRSDRKTTAIRILPDGTVEVRAPRRLSRKAIEDFLLEKHSWIETHRQAALDRLPADLAPRRILYLGQWYDLLPTDRNAVYREGDRFLAPAQLEAEPLKAALAGLMKQLAKAYLLPRTAGIAADMGLAPAKIGITSARTKWASCSDGRNINYSWRLMAAPVEVIDYVIVHELCHMREMNHSARFWALVEKQCPNWRTLRARLPETQRWLDAYYGR